MKRAPKIEEIHWKADIEEEVLKKWEEEKLYSFDLKASRPVYSIDTPPPYINTPVHIGHAYTYVWMDAIARYRRMKGYNVLFPMGFDRNGLPIEVQAEKEFKMDIRRTSREEFIEKCKELLEKYGNISQYTFKRLGLSVNSWEKKYELGGLYETDDPEYRKLTQETFILLFKKGLVYESERTANYCPDCKTTISDAEVEYREEPTTLYYINFQLKNGESITIATTRPELLPACKLIIYNPEDERYEGLKGKKAKIPIFNHVVEIIPHPYAKPEFGTGLMMVCSYGDSGDIMILRELEIKPTYVIDEEGRMNENAGPYKGLKVKDAKARIAQDLERLGFLVKKETVIHRIPICWRSKTPIEFIPTKEIYLKQIKFREELLKAVEGMKFFAPRSKNLLIDWINGLKVDWVISRRRYYGTEIPLWYCKNCGHTYVPEPGRYYRPWRENPPIERCPKCDSTEFIGEERIFDTWFDSSSSQQYILGYLWNRKFFEENYPCSLRPQGKEIVRNWLYFTFLKSYLLFNKPPFKHVWIHMHVVDEKGIKMSKSLGNVVDPQEVIKRYGAEAFRIWSFLEGDITEGDIRCSYSRIEGNAKFLTKLWNMARFISSFPIVKDEKLTATDKWIIGELNNLIKRVDRFNEEYSFNRSALTIRDFSWNLFAAHYIEMVKPRAYGTKGFTEEEQKAAWFTLHMVFRNLLLLLAPLVPFITDHIYRKLYSKRSIHAEEFPKPIEIDEDLTHMTEEITAFNSQIWNFKKLQGKSLRDPIKIEIPHKLKRFAKDLIAMHHIVQ
jgi:valyl-tRNA synthetase